MLAQLKPPLEPIRILTAGNVRDYKSWEGYPTIDSERVAIGDLVLAKDPDDDSTFLRYSAGSPLASAGPEGSPIGAPGAN